MIMIIIIKIIEGGAASPGALLVPPLDGERGLPGLPHYFNVYIYIYIYIYIYNHTDTYVSIEAIVR